MSRISLCLFAGLLAILWCGTAAAAQDDSKALMEKVCSKCHDLEATVSQRNTRDKWEAIVDEMIGRGAEATDSEFEKIIDYLAKTQGPRVKVNRATAQELAGALEVPVATAAAVVAHREKSGPFQTLDDLKKVPALEGKDLDSKKERLDFSTK